MMGMKNIPVAFNLDDVEQLELYNFIKQEPNGKKRNASAFIKDLVNRERKNQQRMSSKTGIKIDLR